MILPRDPIADFQDRDQAKETFDNVWNSNTTWILVFHGFSGHGKSILINWLEANYCQKSGIAYAIADFKTISDDVSLLDYLLEYPSLCSHIPEALYQNYKEQRDTILAERARQAMNINVKQLQIGGSYNSQTVSGFENIQAEIEKLTRTRLINAWLDCIQGIKVNKLALFFDSFELHQDRVPEAHNDWFWMVLSRLRDKVPFLKVVIGSSEAIKWQERNIVQFQLDTLDRINSERLMLKIGVTDRDFIEAVYVRLAHGHPLLTTLAAESWVTGVNTGKELIAREVPNLDLEKAIEWIQSRVIERLHEPLRDAANYLPLLRNFNLDILNSLLPDKLNLQQFNQLCSYSFIQSFRDSRGWSCHPLVRRIQLNYLRRVQPKEFENFHVRAFAYFEENENPVEAMYHHFFSDPNAAIQEWLLLEEKVSSSFTSEKWRELFAIIDTPEMQMPELHNPRLIWRRARYAHQSGQNVEAEMLCKEAASLYKSTSDKIGEANSLELLGTVQRLLGKTEEGIINLNNAFEIYVALDSQWGQANCLYELGEMLRGVGRLKAAQEYLQKGLETFERINNRFGQATCHHGLGNLHGYLTDTQLQNHLELAIELFDKIGHLQGKANALHSLGDLYRSLEEPTSALNIYEDCLTIYRNINDKLGEARSLRGIGNCWLLRREPNLAEIKFTEALEVYKLTDYPLGQANCLNGLGDSHWTRAHLNQHNSKTFHHEILKAIESYNQALPIYRGVNDQSSIAYCLYSIGDAHWLAQNLSEAKAFFEEALTVYGATDNSSGKIQVYFKLADIEGAQMRFTQVKNYYREIINIADQKGFDNSLIQEARRRYKML